MKKKATIVLTALALVLCFAIGGTLAWLVDKTDAVVNTFTYGDISIELWENDYNPTTGELTGSKVTSESDYKMIPGNILPKNPTVTVEANSEDCWLFIKIEESTNFDNFMAYAVNTGNNAWTALGETNYPGVYYREITASTEDQEFSILGAGSVGEDENAYSWNENEVFVLQTVTKDALNALKFDDPDTADVNESTLPTLTFTAYAVQKDNVDSVAEAWAIAMPDSSTK